jgi:hypothetical protein
MKKSELREIIKECMLEKSWQTLAGGVREWVGRVTTSDEEV